MVGMAGVPEGTAAMVALLDQLAVPVDWGRPKVRRLLEDKGHGARNGPLAAAIKHRKNRLEQVGDSAPGQVAAGTFRPFC